MRTLTQLTSARMKRDKNRTIAKFSSIALCTVLVTTLLCLMISLRTGMRDAIISRSGDWHFTLTGLTAQQVDALYQDERITVTNTFQSLTNTSYEAQILFNKITFSYGTQIERISSDAGVQMGNGSAMLTQRALMLLDGIWTESNAAVFVLIIVGVLFLMAIGIGSIIKNTLEISINSNLRELGMLRSLGATPRQIFKIMFAEMNIIAVTAIPIGIVLGFLLGQLCITIANNALVSLNSVGIGIVKMHIDISVSIILLIIVYTYIVLVYADLRLTRKLKELNILAAITGLQIINENSKKVKFPNIVYKVLHVEGVLAYKNKKRSPRPYRSVTTALLLSVAFFIFCASAGQMVVSIAQRNLPLDEYNMSITVNGIKLDDMLQIEEALVKLPNQQTRMGLINFSAGTFVDIQDYTKEALERVPNIAQRAAMQLNNSTGHVGVGVVIRAVDNDSFAMLCENANIGSYRSDVPWGIIYNDYTFETEGNQFTVPIYDFSRGDMLTLSVEDNPKVELAAVEAGPSPFYEDRYSDIIKIYMSRESLLPLTEALIGQTSSYIYRVRARNVFEFEASARNLIENTFGIPAESVNIVNYMAQSQAYSTVSWLIVFFAAIVVALITLVCASNIFVVVDYNLTIRKREFAMLRSIGMPPSGVKRMLIFDSIGYFIKPLLIGVLLGIAPIVALFFLIRKVFIIKISLPVVQILLCVCVLVFLIVLLAVYSIKKTDRMKLMDEIRQ